MTQSSTYPAIPRQMHSITSGKPSFLHHPQADIIPLSHMGFLHHSDAQAFKTAPTPIMQTVTIKIFDKRALWCDKIFPMETVPKMRFKECYN